MLEILPTSIALLLMYFVNVHCANQRYNKKFLDAFSLMAVTVAGYLKVVIICDQVFVISSAGQSVCFAILLLLIMSPAVIVVRAQKTESKQREEPALALCLLDLVRTCRRTKKTWMWCRPCVKLTSGCSSLRWPAGWDRGSFGYTSRETSTLVSLWNI